MPSPLSGNLKSLFLLFTTLFANVVDILLPTISPAVESIVLGIYSMRLALTFLGFPASSSSFTNGVC